METSCHRHRGHRQTEKKKWKKEVRASHWSRPQQHTLSDIHTSNLKTDISKSTPKRNLTGGEKAPEAGKSLEQTVQVSGHRISPMEFKMSLYNILSPFRDVLKCLGPGSLSDSSNSE